MWPPLTQTNVAVAGQTVATMITNAASVVDTLYSVGASRTTLVVWGGTNDLYFGADAATTYSRIVSYCNARKAAGWRVAVLTILPRTQSGIPAGFETERAALNALLRADAPTATAYSKITTGASYADFLVDVADDSLIGDAGDELNTTYYSSDKVHLVNAGYAIIASYVKNALILLR